MMSPRQAAAVFARYGVSAAELASQAGIKAARNRLMMQAHTDHAQGSADQAAEINLAYDVLKHLPEGYYDAAEPALPQGAPGSLHDRILREAAAPAWQTDRYATDHAVAHESYSDANYVKRRLWEMSGCSNDAFELFYFDGAWRKSITVFASPNIHAEMARAVMAWNGPSRGFGHRAVLARRLRDQSLKLIYLDGHTLRQPVEVMQDGFAHAPGNDQAFLQRLPGLLDAVAKTLATCA